MRLCRNTGNPASKFDARTQRQIARVRSTKSPDLGASWRESPSPCLSWLRWPYFAVALAPHTPRSGGFYSQAAMLTCSSPRGRGPFLGVNLHGELSRGLSGSQGFFLLPPRHFLRPFRSPTSFIAGQQQGCWQPGAVQCALGPGWLLRVPRSCWLQPPRTGARKSAGGGRLGECARNQSWPEAAVSCVSFCSTTGRSAPPDSDPGDTGLPLLV